MSKNNSVTAIQIEGNAIPDVAKTLALRQPDNGQIANGVQMTFVSGDVINVFRADRIKEVNDAIKEAIAAQKKAVALQQKTHDAYLKSFDKLEAPVDFDSDVENLVESLKAFFVKIDVVSSAVSTSCLSADNKFITYQTTATATARCKSPVSGGQQHFTLTRQYPTPKPILEALKEYEAASKEVQEIANWIVQLRDVRAGVDNECSMAMAAITKDTLGRSGEDGKAYLVTLERMVQSQRDTLKRPQSS